MIDTCAVKMYVPLPLIFLITVSQSSHSAHNTEDVVIGGVHTNLCRGRTFNRCVRKNKLKSRVINTRKVAGAGWLVLLRAKRKGVHVNTGIRGSRVGEKGLYQVKVRTFTLRKPILTVQLKFGSDDRVFAPAMEGECRFG